MLFSSSSLFPHGTHVPAYPYRALMVAASLEHDICYARLPESDVLRSAIPRDRPSFALHRPPRERALSASRCRIHRRYLGNARVPAASVHSAWLPPESDQVYIAIEAHRGHVTTILVFISLSPCTAPLRDHRPLSLQLEALVQVSVQQLSHASGKDRPAVFHDIS